MARKKKNRLHKQPANDLDLWQQAIVIPIYT